MSGLQFKSVIEYMANQPDGEMHKRMLQGQILNKTGKTLEVDISQMEIKNTSATELATIAAGNFHDRFILKDMHRGFDLKVRTTAVNSATHDHQRNTSTKNFTFLSSTPWYLDPIDGYSHEYTRSMLSTINDKIAKQYLAAACANLPGAAEHGLNMQHVQRKLTTVPDLRHLFMKLYLYLHDYNLGTCSKMKFKERNSDMRMHVYNNVTDEQRLDLICERDFVVDRANLTDEEVSLLLLGVQEYPSVWYAEDNIYNQTHMRADSFALVSSGTISVIESLAWGSPTRMYEIITTLACKLGAIDGMMEAFGTMRGKCQMMKDMMEMTNGSNVVIGDAPLSFSMANALGKNVIPEVIPKTYGGWYSTTTCLISDIIFGSLYKMEAANLVEVTGGLGESTVNKHNHDVRLDPRYNGILRDHGLKHQEPLKNRLMLAWSHLANRPLLWAFGGMLKEYVLQLTHKMRNGYDVHVPQFTSLIQFSIAESSCWGMVRNFTAPYIPMMNTKEQRSEQMVKNAAFLWCMGLRPLRPKTGANEGSYKDILLSESEFDWINGTQGAYTIQNVSYSMACDVEPREDETEQSATTLMRDEYMHTRCNMVYDYQDGWRNSLVIAEDGREEQLRYRESFKNTVPAHLETQRVEKTQLKRGYQPIKIMGANNTKAILRGARIEKIGKNGDYQSGMGYEIKGQGYRTKLVENEPVPGADDRIKLVEVNTKGDGLCGINAIVQNMAMRGYCTGADSIIIHNRLKDEAATETWHEIADVARLADTIKMGVDLYCKDPAGDYMLTRYDQQNELRLPIIYENGHYSSAIVENDENGSLITDVIHQESANLPEELAAIIEARAGH